ncbi:MAG: acyltransferase [Leptospirales bacterium]|nr:acyltransferase [Leptospirales bacterium]
MGKANEGTSLSKTESKINFFKRFIYNIIGCLSLLYITINTIILFSPLFILSLIKLIPFIPLQRICTKLIIVIATCWINNNTFLFKNILRVNVNVKGDFNLTMKDWYFVISNHQSWSDIIILQMIFTGKIPLLKFFIKQELIWVPLLGIAWWALDFPFMKRYSPEFIEKNPHLKGKDIEITKKACEKFNLTPVSVMNFVEGTRFTEAKHKRQKSPYKNLLKPKAGGIGFVFTAMGSIINSILNVTIKYPGNDTSFWHFLCGRITEVDFLIERINMTDELIGDYVSDSKYQAEFKKWVNDLWVKKDDVFDKM